MSILLHKVESPSYIVQTKEVECKYFVQSRRSNSSTLISYVVQVELASSEEESIYTTWRPYARKFEMVLTSIGNPNKGNKNCYNNGMLGENKRLVIHVTTTSSIANMASSSKNKTHPHV